MGVSAELKSGAEKRRSLTVPLRQIRGTDIVCVMTKRRSRKPSAVREDEAPYGKSNPLKFIDLFCGIGGEN